MWVQKVKRIQGALVFSIADGWGLLVSIDALALTT